MNLKFSFKKISDWATRRNKPKERVFINLDGSPYGTKGVMRFIRTPSVQGRIVASIFFAAANALTAPEHQRLKYFISNLLFSALTFPFTKWICVNSIKRASNRFSENFTANDRAIIDKSGYVTGSDPKATISCISATKRCAIDTIKEACIIPSAIAFAKVALGQNIETQEVIAFIAVPIHLTIQSGWFLRVSNKLENGKWTLHTSPPLPHKKEEKAKVPVGATADTPKL